jgi:large subunit ribosomal protein L5e
MIHSFKKQFSTYLADGVGSEDMEEIYTNAYAAIREDPTFKPTDKEKDWRAESKKYSTTRLTLEQRKAKIQTKIETFKASGGAAADEDDDEDDE